MIIDKVVTNIIGVNSYIIKDGNQSAVIDPGGKPKQILEMIKGTTLKYIFITHGHFDHIMAVEDLKKLTNAKVLISKEDAPMLSDNNLNHGSKFGFTVNNTEADEIISDGDIIKIGNSKLKVISTPGHSKGSVCYYDDGFLFSGDTLFKMSIGIYDYENVDTMKKSVAKLLELPDDTIVYPGHNEETTIGYERINNPYSDFSWEWI